MADIDLIQSKLKRHPDFPKQGILFLDILPIFQDPLTFEALITHLIHRITSHTLTLSNNNKIDVVVGLEARGFLLGPIIALRLGASFVPVRKQGKLPGQCVQATYAKEYGVDTFEMQVDAIKPGQNVIVIDDLIATGGSARAAGELVKQQGGKTLEYLFIVEIPFLSGSSQVDAPIYSLIQCNE